MGHQVGTHLPVGKTQVLEHRTRAKAKVLSGGPVSLF